MSVTHKSCTFAPVELTTKRHIASWVLLAVFVPMLLMSSLHFHETSQIEETTCAECVQHQCHGHLTQLSDGMHQCVLCQFTTLTFVAAVVCAVLLFNNVSKTLIAQRQCDVRLDVCGVPALRAPPFV